MERLRWGHVASMGAELTGPRWTTRGDLRCTHLGSDRRYMTVQTAYPPIPTSKPARSAIDAADDDAALAGNVRAVVIVDVDVLS